MTPSEYQSLAARTECDQEKSRVRLSGEAHDFRGLPCGTDRLAPTRINHAVLGLSGEVGELAGAVEKWLYYGQHLDVANVKEEIGDCLWYLALLCNAAGFDLEQIMQSNINKLKVRYPEKYTDEYAKTRDREAENRAAASPLEVMRAVDEVAKTVVAGDPRLRPRIEQDGHGFGHTVIEDK